jgi:hypothetical protein
LSELIQKLNVLEDMQLDGRTRDLAKRDTCSVSEAADVLGVSRALAYRAAAAGDLPGALRIRGRWVVATRILLKALGFEEEPAKQLPARDRRAAQGQESS